MLAAPLVLAKSDTVEGGAGVKEGSCLISGLTALFSIPCCAAGPGEEAKAAGPVAVAGGAVAGVADAPAAGTSGAKSDPPDAKAEVVPAILAGATGFSAVGVEVSRGVREPDFRDDKPAGEGCAMGGLGTRLRVGGMAVLAAFSKSSTWREAGLLLLPPDLPLSCAARDLQSQC